MAHSHGGARHLLGEIANLLQQGHTQLGAQSGDDGANQQGGEQPLGHGAHGVHKVKPAVGFHRFPDAVPLLRGGGWGLFSMVQKNLPFSEERGRRKTAGRFLAVSSPWFFRAFPAARHRALCCGNLCWLCCPKSLSVLGRESPAGGFPARWSFLGRYWRYCLFSRFGYWNIIAQMGGGWKGKRGDFPRQQKKNTQALA